MTRERWIQIAVVVALATLAAVTAWSHWRELAASPFPVGVDGYYYPVQVRSLLEHGTLAYPAAPLTLWWMVPFAAATDPITGAKLGAAIAMALIAFPAYGVAVRLTRARGAGLIAAALATTSAGAAYLKDEFVKQGVGLGVALAAIWLLLRALETPSRRRILAATLGVVGAMLAHKLAAAAVLAIGLPAIFAETRTRGHLRGRRLLYILVALATGGVIVIVIGIAAPHRFLSSADLALLGDLITTHARWDLPALDRPAVLDSPAVHLVFRHEAAIGAAFALIAALVLALRAGGAEARPRRSYRIIAWSFVVLGLLIAVPWLDVGAMQGLAFRLRVSAFVPLAMCAAIVAAPLGRWLAKDATWKRDAALAALAIVIVVRAPRVHTEGVIPAHPALVSAVMAASTKIPSGTTVIVPERQVMFMVAWYTRAPVVLRPEHVPYGRRIRLLTGNFIEGGSPLEQALDASRADPRVHDPPLSLHPGHRNGLVLVAEPTWDWLLAQLPPGARDYWERWRTI